MRRRCLAFAVALAVLAGALWAGPAAACGGFFCTTVPIDQAGERVIFTMDPGSITTYVQISYTGRAEDFAWVLPLPAVPKVETAQMQMFRDLDRLTQPVYIPPRPPACLRLPQPVAAAPAGARAASSEGVNVLASGEVGPFGYHVVSSSDPQDLVLWLRENGYQITREMEPLVKVYTDEGLIFLAMKLKQGQNATDIVPVKLTYESSLPMIPLRLTAVAATPDMPVFVWIFANNQVAPVNFVPIKIADSEVGFTPFGRNDYQRVVSRAADQAGGRAFVTEFAGATTAVRPPTDETVKLLFQQYPYLTRLYTRISPEEMTVDPLFDVDSSLPDVSNIHDLSNRPSPWRCDDDPFTFRTVADSGPPPSYMEAQRYLQGTFFGGGPKAGLLLALVAVSLGMVRFGPRIRLPRHRLSLAWLAPARIAALRLAPLTVALLFAETVALQGFHEMEHVVQVLQRTVFGVASGAGMLGSVFDIEPVHMIYNAAFLALLVPVYVAARNDPRVIPARTRLVQRLLLISVLLQAYHGLEHVVKMWQYVQWGMNGTPGILGYWTSVVWLHFAINTIVFVPIVWAFVAGGFAGPVGRLCASALPRHVSPRLASIAVGLLGAIGAAYRYL
ncbi:MAG: DUF2330 domain-containing protein [Chloroflexota bacterium]